jgi:hypothetical protein
MQWTRKHVGLWIDNDLGLGYSMARLAELMAVTNPQFKQLPPATETHRLYPDGIERTYQDLVTGSAKYLTDDHHALDHGVEYLQEHTEEGLAWVWDGYAGGLLLVDTDDPEWRQD